MVFKDYCIVIMGETEGALVEIKKICDDNPKVLNAKGILIATFNSVADAKELEDYFTSLDRSFFLFEVGAENTGYNIKNKKIHEGLFSHIESELNDLTEKSNRLMDELEKGGYPPLPDDIKKMIYDSKSGTTKENIPEWKIGGGINLTEVKVDSEVRINKSYYNNLSEKEKDETINNIIDKGYSNLTDLDKQILDFLTKKK